MCRLLRTRTGIQNSRTMVTAVRAQAKVCAAVALLTEKVKSSSRCLQPYVEQTGEPSVFDSWAVSVRPQAG